MIDFGAAVVVLLDAILAWGWILVMVLALWIAWEVYRLIKHIEYVSTIEWTVFEISIPEDNDQTPKAMENAFEVWGGIHKNPDLVEKYFMGYFLAWYSCEIWCRQNEVRYFMIVPTAHAKFFEGVIYGQYPSAEVKEAPDYTRRFDYRNLEKTYDLWSADIELVESDIYPIRVYREYEEALAEDIKFMDPHQALVEAYSNVGSGEEFWVQVLIRPIDAGAIAKWAEKGQEEISKISGKPQEDPEPNLFVRAVQAIASFPLLLMKAAFEGPEALVAEEEKQERILKFSNPAEDAAMKGILQKVSRTGFLAKIRVIYIAPAGKLYKPNISKAVGAFKQFNTFHLNSFKPSRNKTNGPNYFMKHARRMWRKRVALVNYQSRDFWGDESGQMMTAEELATIFHLPTRYVRTPGVTWAKSGMATPPDNLPYV